MAWNYLDVADITGTAYQPMLHIIGKGDHPADIVLNPRTHQAIDNAIDGRTHGPILVNTWGNRMRRHNVAAMLVRLANTAAIDVHITPHALRRSYITMACSKACRCATCNVLPATPRPTPPSATTNPNSPSTATPPSY